MQRRQILSESPLLVSIKKFDHTSGHIPPEFKDLELTKVIFMLEGSAVIHINRQMVTASRGDLLPIHPQVTFEIKDCKTSSFSSFILMLGNIRMQGLPAGHCTDYSVADREFGIFMRL